MTCRDSTSSNNNTDTLPADGYSSYCYSSDDSYTFTTTVARASQVFAITVLLLLCLAANSCMIYAVISTRHRGSMLSASSLLLINLATTDLLVGTLVLPMWMVATSTLSWPLPDLLCDLTAFLTVTLMVSSILSFSAIAVDRYLHLVYPLRYPTEVTPPRLAAMLVMLWLLCVVVAGMPLCGWGRYSFQPQTLPICNPVWAGQVGYSLFVLLAGLALPFLVMLTAYVRIVRIASRHIAKIEATHVLPVSSSLFPSPASSRSARRVFSVSEARLPTDWRGITDNSRESDGLLGSPVQRGHTEVFMQDQLGHSRGDLTNHSSHTEPSVPDYGRLHQPSTQGTNAGPCTQETQDGSLKADSSSTNNPTISITSYDTHSPTLSRSHPSATKAGRLRDTPPSPPSPITSIAAVTSPTIAPFAQARMTPSKSSTRGSGSQKYLTTGYSARRPAKRGSNCVSRPGSTLGWATRRVFSKSVHTANRVFVAVGVFFLCWGPYVVLNLWSVNTDTHAVPYSADLLTTLLAFSNSAINPVLFLLIHKDYRTRVRSLGRACCGWCLHRKLNELIVGEKTVWMESVADHVTSVVQSEVMDVEEPRRSRSGARNAW